MAQSVHIGTSGWSYTHWKGPFYPEDAADRDLLGHYAKHFDTAEINNSFYRLPEPATLRSWRHAIPEGFVFSAKASRYITHQKKLKDPEQSTQKFFDGIGALGDVLGPRRRSAAPVVSRLKRSTAPSPLLDRPLVSYYGHLPCYGH